MIRPALIAVLLMSPAMAAAAEAPVPSAVQEQTPQALMEQASALVQSSIAPAVNLLEYWGPDPSLQAQTRPAVLKAQDLLEQAERLAAHQAADLAATLAATATDEQVARWTELDRLAGAARYTRQMLEYERALVSPGPQQAQIAAHAIGELQTYDNPETLVQPAVRLRLARLHLLLPDTSSAGKLLVTLIRAQTTPAPDLAQQFEARYFRAHCDLLNRNAAAAQMAIDALMQWQAGALANDAQMLAGADAAVAILRYRLQELQDASDPTGVLLDLVQRRPELRPVVVSQLVGRIPGDPDCSRLPLLMLEAILERARRPEASSRHMSLGVDAARQLLQQAGVTPPLADSARLLIPVLLERLDQPNQAAEAYLDYAQDPAGDMSRRRAALDRAGALAREDAPGHQRFVTLAANPPFSLADVMFDYGRILQQQGKYADAIAAYRRVPADDPRLLHARFLEMLAIKQQIDSAGDSLSPGLRDKLLFDVQQRFEEIGDAAHAAMATAKDHSQQASIRAILVKRALLAAQMALPKDPARALIVLDGLEEHCAGQPNRDELLATTLLLRVQAYMAQGRNADAADALVAMLNARGGTEGAALVHRLLAKLDDDLSSARSASDRQSEQRIAEARAALAGHLVGWAQMNSDPAVRQQVARYRLFEASTKLQAAQLQPQSPQRLRQLTEALAILDALPQENGVSLQRALVCYELGDYATAEQTLGELISARKLGPPALDNEPYWEAMAKWMDCVARSQEPAKLEQLRTLLKRLYIQWGSDIGGRRWHELFESLRRQLLPDWTPAH